MSNTKANSRVQLTMLARQKEAGLNQHRFNVLLALSANTGPSTITDINKASTVIFNWALVSELYHEGLITRARRSAGKRAPWLYSITPYGEKVLDYIATGKGQV